MLLVATFQFVIFGSAKLMFTKILLAKEMDDIGNRW